MIKLLFPKNLTFSPSFTSPSHLAPPLLLQLSHLSSSSYNTSFLRPRDDETRSERNVGVSVWWEIDSCYLPADVNGYKVTRFITEALRSKGIKGPLQIKAFGDVLRLSHANQEALSSTGINLVHIPYGLSVNHVFYVAIEYFNVCVFVFLTAYLFSLLCGYSEDDIILWQS